MDTNTLNLFFGQSPSEDFLEDLEILKELQEKEVREITDWIIETYPKGNLDKEWEELSKDFNKKYKKEKEKIIRTFRFIFKQFAVGHINESELKEDAKKLNIPEEHIDFFIKKISENKEFRKRALRQEQPYRNLFAYVDWRIDKQNYGHDFEENICVLEFAYYSKGEEHITQFELDLEGLRQLRFVLKIIDEKLCKLM